MAGTTVQATQADLLRRDKYDSGRATAPLTMADDAHHIDTTPYTLDEVIEALKQMKDDPLANAGTNVVVSRGNPNAKLLIIGEAPGFSGKRAEEPANVGIGDGCGSGCGLSRWR